MKIVKRALIGLLCLLPMLPAYAAKVDTTMLLYMRKESGVKPYPSRILVTPRYVRMDDNSDKGDYLLFDRRKHIIHSVTHSDGTVLDIPERKVTMKPPVPLKLTQKEVKTDGMPKVAGREPHHWLLLVNGKRCYDVVAVRGLLDNAVAALREFRQVLAGESAKTLRVTPADLQDPCDMATHTFAPARHLKFGLPIQEWDNTGYGRTLLDYKTHLKVDAKLFTLPKGYVHYTSDKLPQL